PVDYVNPLIGTFSDFSLSNGNTYPAIGLPFGMNYWTPQTAKNGDGWQYTYQAKKITGFKQTHQPSPWINDYGCFSLMPMVGKPVIDPLKRASWFSHKSEISKPNYYSVYLADYDVTTEITATERAAQIRFTFGDNDTALIVIDGFHKGSSLKYIPSENKIVGYSSYNSGGVPANFRNYFVIHFNSPAISTSVWNDTVISKGSEIQAKKAGMILEFIISSQKVINIQVASSFISLEQAELNLQREVGKDTFEQTLAKATEIWNKELGKIEIEGGTKDQLTTFYTALYRTFLFPRKFYEYNKDNQMVHYSPFNGEVLPGPLFTDNGFWDTFRAAFPLSTILNPELNSLMMEGLSNTYKESGWLPEWASPGHRDCMIGSNSAAIIADSYLKGIRGYDINTLYEAILKNSENQGPLSSVGRLGVEYYNSLGYIPYDVDINENVARTLEYAYDDFSIMKLAQALGRPKSEIDIFSKRSQNYRNVFNPGTRFMQGRNKDGSFQTPFVPEKWGDAFTEGCSWHYTWCVFHDIKGLQKLMGGKQMFASKLDSLFTAPPLFDFSYYGYQIHEITEMLIADMGQYAHGNQPIQHGIYLFNYAEQPWKTQYWVREAMNRLYTSLPDGLCGDEDNGQTSAWYVFSAMGFYPVCPGTGEYVLGAPLFNKITLHLSDNKRFTISAKNNNAENRYKLESKLNGKAYTKLYLTHSDLMKGGEMDIIMNNKPNKAVKLSTDDLPFSASN
ncbi:MAG TPA: GH92 family glycosyl hydrolase, partial [Lentimicrobium sp.]|nr:GH92 family glycosyl hydrolase [Lentimicrobium sp.]